MSPDGRTVAFERVKIFNHYNPKNPFNSGLLHQLHRLDCRAEGGRHGGSSPGGNGLSYPRPRTRRTARCCCWNGTATVGEVRNRRPGPRRRTLRVIARRAEEPVYSPDGSRIALIDYRDGLTVETTEALNRWAGLRRRRRRVRPARLTRTATAQESQPAWSPSGERIAFVRVPGPGRARIRRHPTQANTDGRCARRVTGSKGWFGARIYGPAWQPGPGREAARLAC